MKLEPNWHLLIIKLVFRWRLAKQSVLLGVVIIFFIFLDFAWNNTALVTLYTIKLPSLTDDESNVVSASLTTAYIMKESKSDSLSIALAGTNFHSFQYLGHHHNICHHVFILLTKCYVSGLEDASAAEASDQEPAWHVCVLHFGGIQIFSPSWSLIILTVMRYLIGSVRELQATR